MLSKTGRILKKDGNKAQTNSFDVRLNFKRKSRILLGTI